MNYKAVTDESIIASVTNGYKRTKLFDLLYRFQQDGIAVAEVETEGYRTPSSCTGALKNAIKRFGFAQIKVATVEGKVYLINEAGNTKLD